jgi:hypothetical protein
MSPECAWDTVLNAAVAQWAGNTAQHELREALDQVLEQVGDNTLRRALELPPEQERQSRQTTYRRLAIP